MSANAQSPFLWRGKPSAFVTDKRFTPEGALTKIALAKAAKQPLPYTSIKEAA